MELARARYIVFWEEQWEHIKAVEGRKIFSISNRTSSSIKKSVKTKLCIYILDSKNLTIVFLRGNLNFGRKCTCHPWKGFFIHRTIVMKNWRLLIFLLYMFILWETCRNEKFVYYKTFFSEAFFSPNLSPHLLTFSLCLSTPPPLFLSIYCCCRCCWNQPQQWRRNSNVNRQLLDCVLLFALYPQSGLCMRPPTFLIPELSLSPSLPPPPISSLSIFSLYFMVLWVSMP